MADLLPHPRSYQNGKYTKYSHILRTFGCGKISRHQQLLLIYCESSAFTVEFQTNASASPLAGQPALMHNKFPCASGAFMNRGAPKSAWEFNQSFLNLSARTRKSGCVLCIRIDGNGMKLLRETGKCGIINPKEKGAKMMSDIDSIVREVDSSMTMEGMPLYSEDKDRIRKCLENPGSLEKMIGTLVKKHTVPIRTRKTV